MPEFCIGSSAIFPMGNQVAKFLYNVVKHNNIGSNAKKELYCAKWLEIVRIEVERQTFSFRTLLLSSPDVMLKFID
jgi:hypothetical protein